MTYISDIAQYLDDQGIGTLGTDLFISKLNEDDHNAIMIKPTGGANTEKYIDLPIFTFQIWVQNKSYATAETNAFAVRDLLHNKANVTLVTGGEYFMYITLQQEPSFLGYDEQDRAMFSFNFIAKVRKS